MEQRTIKCEACDKEVLFRNKTQRFCSPKCRYSVRKKKSLNTDRQYLRISGNWNRYFARLVAKGSRQTHLSTAFLVELLNQQNGRCALSGVQLTCTLVKGERIWTNASIDRINAGKAYTRNNIQLVCAAINQWRGTHTVSEFVKWCKLVTAFQEEPPMRKRNYRNEYDSYHADPSQKKNRALRNAARRELTADGRVKKGDGKEVDHKKMLKDGGSNAKSNLRVTSASKNRAWRKGKS